MNASLPYYEQPDFLNVLRRRIADDLNLLATLHDHEPDAAVLKELKKIDFPFCLTIIPEDGPGIEAIQLLVDALTAFADNVEQDTLNDLAADYASIYLNYNISASPEESVWLDEDSLVCQQSMFDVRNWYEAYGLEIPNWRLRPDDHLVYELQFIAKLLERDEKIKTLEQIATFMDEHLLRWLGNFAERVLARCDTQYFAALAAITAAYCEEFREILVQVLEQPRPSREEIDERMQPKTIKADELPMQYMPGMGPSV